MAQASLPAGFDTVPWFVIMPVCVLDLRTMPFVERLRLLQKGCRRLNLRPPALLIAMQGWCEKRDGTDAEAVTHLRDRCKFQ